MAFVDEGLVFLTCTVILVEGKPVVRVVSPAVVAVKFLYRHELDGIYAEVLDIVETLHSACDVLRSSEVTEKHLIDHEVVLVLHLEV